MVKNMATIRDIAKAAGVSVGTASRAITGNGYVSEENRTLVMQAAENLGYTPKERKKTSTNTKTVGVILPDATFPFYGSFLKYAEVELARRGYRTVVCNTLGVQNRVSGMLDLLSTGELDGLILNADVTPEEIARMENLPVVSFERLLGKKIPMVSSDHCQGGRMAAAELLRSGCKKVMLLAARHSNRLFGDSRIEECRRLLESEGVEVIVAEIPGSLLSIRYTKEVIREYLLLYSDVDGIFTDDLMAFCCMMEAQERGIIIPDQLRIVGYDGTEILKIVSPRLTTIVQDIPQLTKSCVDLLMRRIAGEKTEEETIVPVTFMKGGTT